MRSLIFRRPTWRFNWNLRNYSRVSSEESCECEGVRRCSPPLINPQNLPYLPIPKLQNTLEKFIQSCQPFVGYMELKDTVKMCETFEKKEGKYLQKYLIERANSSYNWLDEWYTQCAYLCLRESLPMTTSPIIVFPSQKFRKSYQQKKYAAKLILAVLKFRKLCYCDQLSLDKWKNFPLDMGVYKKLFSNIRLPKPFCDQLVHTPNSQHIVVFMRNNIFKMKVLNNCGEPLSFQQLKERLDEIMTYGQTTGVPFGLLTSLKRDTWANLYNHMKRLPGNEENLKSIEEAIFVINLDRRSPCEDCSELDQKVNSCLNGFHGFGPKINGANRWYGKTLQFYIMRDGASGIIFEHSPVEAIPLGRMADFIIDFTTGEEWRSFPDIVMRERPTKLHFHNSQDIKNCMNDAAEGLEEKIANFKVHLLHYDRYGKQFIKENQMSPDAVVQAALQFAHMRYHGSVVPQHETASTRRFYLGRSDTIRSCTNEVIRFIKSMRNKRATTKEKYNGLKMAAWKHRELTNDVMMGKGIDRHLFGLLMASKELKMPRPDIFRSAAYDKSGRFRIVTRQNPTRKKCFTCYAPGLDGGYGCCYNPRAEDINMCVTSRKCDKEYDPEKFLDSWVCSMKNIGELLMTYNVKEKEISCK